MYGAITLYGVAFQLTSILMLSLARIQRAQFNITVNFHRGLFLFRSPLLKESLLVSFPPLIDMLKFRGYSG